MPRYAPSTPNGTPNRTANGIDQLSYCAARTRNTMMLPNASTRPPPVDVLSRQELRRGGDQRGRETVEPRHDVRSAAEPHRRQRRYRNELRTVPAHVETADVLGLLAIWLLRLDLHAIRL